MSSLRRVLASRANGARSRGPVTEEGKRRSSLNAMSHGMLARCVVMDNESPECFKLLFDQHIETIQPADGVELGFVEEMVAAHWRMRRAWAIETRMYQDAANAYKYPDALGAMAAGFTTLASSPTIALMHRYESRLSLVYQRCLHNLLLLRTLPTPNEPNPTSEQSDLPEPLVIDVTPAEAAPGQPIDAPPTDPVMPNEPNPISGQSDLPETAVIAPTPTETASAPPIDPEMPNECHNPDRPVTLRKPSENEILTSNDPCAASHSPNTVPSKFGTPVNSR